MITQVINLFGAPGTGKSTLAAGLTAKLKMEGREAIYIPELFKAHALAKKTPTYLDEVISFGQQLEFESDYYGLAEFIVTDCPLEQHAFYADYGHVKGKIETVVFHLNHDPITRVVARLRRERLNSARAQNYFLTLGQFPYQRAGRYQNEAESQIIEHNLRLYMNRHLHYHVINPDECFLKHILTCEGLS